MSYDQGYWHTDTTSERGIEESLAGTHIAVYVRWCIGKGLISNDGSGLNESEKQEVVSAQHQTIKGSMGANTYFSQYMDWKFGEWNLTQEGNIFTKVYYPIYGQDIEEQFPNILYGREEDVAWDTVFQLLDSRYKEFQSDGLKHRTQKPDWEDRLLSIHWALWLLFFLVLSIFIASILSTDIRITTIIVMGFAWGILHIYTDRMKKRIDKKDRYL